MRMEATFSEAAIRLVIWALAQAGIPLGAALAGFVVEAVGLVPTILGMGAIYLAVTVAMFFNPALRQMEAGKEP
jgi:predicted MFS family arabinose efflux permease